MLRDRLGVEHFALICDLLVATEHGAQRVRVVHGNQADPYNAFEDPRSPVDTPFGHHVVRDVLPQLEARQARARCSRASSASTATSPTSSAPASSTARSSASCGSWPSPSWPSCCCGCSPSSPASASLLHHHAAGGSIGFGLLVALMVIVAGVAAVATLLRVNRALRETAVSARSDPATHNAPARAEAARLVTEGFAGMISGHTHEPELSVVGNGFYANTGSGTTSVVGPPVPAAPAPALRARRPVLVRRAARRRRARGAALAPRAPGPAPGPPRAAGPGHDRRRDTDHHAVVAALPERPDLAARPGGPQPLGPPPPRPPVRGLGHVRWPASSTSSSPCCGASPAAVRSTGGCPSASTRLTVTGAVVGGLALLGLARGVRRGLRPAWVATIALLAITSIDRLVTRAPAEGSAIAFVFSLWLLLEHGHFRVCPSGVSRCYIWLAAGRPGGRRRGTPASAHLPARPPAAARRRLPRPRGHRGAGACSCPGPAASRAGPEPPGPRRSTRACDHHRDLRRGHPRLLRPARRQVVVLHRRSVAAYSVINGVMLVSPDPIGPPEDRAEVWSDIMDFAQSNNWTPRCWPPPRRGCRSTGRPGWSTTTSATRPSSTARPSPSRASR